MTSKVVQLRQRDMSDTRMRKMAAWAERRLALELQVEAGELSKEQRLMGRAELQLELLEINRLHPQQRQQ